MYVYIYIYHARAYVQVERERAHNAIPFLSGSCGKLRFPRLLGWPLASSQAVDSTAVLPFLSRVHVLQAPQEMPKVWFHVPNIAIKQHVPQIHLKMILEILPA